MSRLSLTVTGMSCAGCEGRISAALGRLEGVRRVDADHRTGSVAVDYDPATVSASALSQRLVDAGYEIATEGGLAP